MLILCCHLVVTFNNRLLQVSAQFFNVGVYLFLIISGYLYGKKDISKNSTYTKWIISRGKRILIPSYIFMSILFCIYIILGLKIEPLNWIVYIFNLQGLEIYVHGAEHLWYLTIAMVCYFITPILDKNKYRLNKQKLIVFFIGYVAIQLITSYFIYEQFGRYLILIGLYILSYLIGFYWNSESIDFKMFILYCISLIFALTLRIIGMIIFDGSTLYDVLIVGYTHCLLGLSIFFIGFYIVKKFELNRFSSIVKKIDAISYEIYLVHYMFIGGPISVLFTNNSIFNCFIVILFTYIFALILNKICYFIIKFPLNKNLN
ncbi:MAG: acyltransferase [Intestinibacter bartlettii]|nr:acyltransferase [Intestinibacter bartlettii]